MRWLPYLTHSTFSLAVLLLAGSQWRWGTWQIGSATLVPLVLWLASRRWPHSRHVAFMVLVGLSGMGAFSALPLWLMLLAVLSSLTAWDLASWQTRLPTGRPPDAWQRLLRRHLGRLAALWGVSIGLLILTQRIELQLGVWSALLLGVLLLLGLSQTVRLLRRPEA